MPHSMKEKNKLLKIVCKFQSHHMNNNRIQAIMKAQKWMNKFNKYRLWKTMIVFSKKVWFIYKARLIYKIKKTNSAN